MEPTTRRDMIKMTNAECRISNEARMTNDKLQLVANASSFEFPSFLRHWSFCVGHLCQHVSGAAGVINNAVRLKQRGNHHHSLCPGVDHALQVVDVDPADTENWQTYFCMSWSDVPEADRRIIRFCRRGEDRTESDIIRSFSLRRDCLFEAVRGISNENLAPCFASRDLD